MSRRLMIIIVIIMITTMIIILIERNRYHTQDFTRTLVNIFSR